MASSSQTVGKYRLLERIAVGRTTEIHRARVEGVGGFQRTFALKLVRPELGVAPEAVAALVEEARTTGLLSHANIVQIMDLGEEDGRYAVAMEHVNGPDLARVLARCSGADDAVPVEHAVFVAIELLKALDYAHQRQVMRGTRPEPLDIVHLGIAPENILTSFQGEVKLTDFGHARSRGRTTTPAELSASVSEYASPEVLGAGPPVDQRSDLFSVGVVLYEMLTGRHPFRGRSTAETRAAIRAGRHRPAHVVRRDLSGALSGAVERAIAVDPDGRFRTAAAMKESLEAWLHEAGVVPGPHGLARMLRQLFPTGAQPTLRPPTGAVRPQRDGLDADPVTHPMADHEDADARPTTLAPPPPPRPRPRPPASPATSAPFDLSQSRAFGPLARAGDESTLIKRLDLPSDPSQWDDAPTRIRPAPDLGELELDLDEDDGGDLLLPEPEVGGAPTVARPSVPPPPRPGPPPRPAPRPAPALRGAGATAAYLAIGAAVACIVLAVGVVLGTQIARIRTAGTPARVQVTAPPGARITLDGADIDAGATTEIEPGKHTLIVRGDDVGAVALDVVLPPGEVAAFHFAPAEGRQESP